MGQVFEKFYTGTTDWKQRTNPSFPPRRDLRTPSSILNPNNGNVPYPDRYYSYGVYCGSDEGIWGASNMTILSHALYLIAEGGEQNGCEIQPQGVDVAQRILFRGWRTYFSTTVTFNEAYTDLVQACNDLYPPAEFPYVVENVTNALQAVELDQPGLCSGIPESAPPCAVHNAGTIASVRQDLTPTSTYAPTEEIWAVGVGGFAGETINLALASHDPARVTWSAITPMAMDSTVVNGDGTFAARVTVAGAVGTFDIIADGNQDGFYQPWADSVLTIAVAISPSGSCCALDGSCTVTPQSLCTAGTWTGSGVCEPNTCPQPGSCCAPDGSCTVTLQAGCTAGTWTTAGVCEPNPCPQPGACCVEAACAIGLQTACQGQWLGAGTTCAPNPCGPTGACCFPDETCTVLTWAQCAGQGGLAYMGDGAVCDPNPCVTSGVGGSRLSTVTTLRTVPNPFGGATTLYLSGPPAAVARVDVFDAAGRLVRTAWEGRLDEREVAIAWDGKDQAGRETPAGMYLVRVESSGGGAVGRLVKMR